MKHTLYTDGGAYNNGTERQKARICVFHEDEKIIHLDIGNHTSNEAEFIAIERAFEWIAKNINTDDEVLILSDSKLAVNMINGAWGGKIKRLRDLRARVQSKRPKNTLLQWTPREKNKAGNFLEFSKEKPEKDTQESLKESLMQAADLVGGGKTLMIDKYVFLKIIELIQTQDRIDQEVGKALERVSDSWVMFNSNNKKYDALNLLLKQWDKDDFISWWLYEDVEKKVTTADGKEYNLKTAEELYDFLKENYA